ncbi:MAG TPA: presenilin family intramembrane aspartyl protease [Methanocorpusculum sp.]|nr:presenilin family intramembrane aspartyl protease [Methanocorpusculum sp.]
MSFRSFVPYLGMIFLMLTTGVVSLQLIVPITHAGIGAFEDPNSIENPFVFMFIMLVFTALLLLLIKWKAQIIISALIGTSIALVIYYVVSALIYSYSAKLPSSFIGVVTAISVLILLWYWPEWYIIDGVGILISAGCAAIFGISLSIIPVLILLILLIVYDAISVHRTKHMLTLADGVLHQKMPIMFIIPKTHNYSYWNSKFSLQDSRDERGAYMIGMGDMILPSILVVSAQIYTGGEASLSVAGMALPALGALIGGLIGLCSLMIPLNSGKPQSGLPYINTGVIIGFLVCSAIAGSWTWI